MTAEGPNRGPPVRGVCVCGGVRVREGKEAPALSAKEG